MILITGATGFLGRAILRNPDIRSYEYISSSLSSGLDLKDYKSTLSFFKKHKPSIILNCAAFVGGIHYGYEQPAKLFYDNLLMTLNLFQVSSETGVERIVNPISNCTYPAASKFFKESEFWDGPLHESVLAYGFARKASVVASSVYNRQHSLDSINFIFSNMYGPEDHFEEERSHALGALIMKIANAKKMNLPQVIVWGSGLPVREWLHVDDAAKVMIKGISCNLSNNLINIGIGKGISIFDLTLMIKKIIGYEGEIVYDKSKPDGAEFKTVDGSLAEKYLNWQPTILFEDGLRDTINWYLTNRDNNENY